MELQGNLGVEQYSTKKWLRTGRCAPKKSGKWPVKGQNHASASKLGLSQDSRTCKIAVALCGIFRNGQFLAIAENRMARDLLPWLPPSGQSPSLIGVV
jgi:hypothetical protein